MKVTLIFCENAVHVMDEDGNGYILENPRAVASSGHTIETLFPGAPMPTQISSTTVLLKETQHLCNKCGNIEVFRCQGHDHTAYLCSDCAVAITF